jgi:Tfp pilus assembly protein PilX
MKTRHYTLQEERGSAIIMAIMVLILLTLLGITSTNTNVTEQQITRNDQIYKRNFYRAEAAAAEAKQRLRNTDFSYLDSTFFTGSPWVSNLGDSFTVSGETDTTDGDGDGFMGLQDTDNWLTGSPPAPTGDVAASTVATNSYFAAQYVDTIGSQVIKERVIHIFEAFGYCLDEGESLISSEYRKEVAL